MIQIPGYRVIRALGRGGMASVHLAVQESVQREVAMKIMAPTLLGDPQFGERFLREARIAARLRHPNVVQVHDVGIAGDLHYMAMEYLPNGPVNSPDPTRRGLRYSLKATREIAAALGYAHARGVVHRDIKPDNILLREDGAAVLTDFGIARASDNVRMTMTGSIMGTPSYMSPEQARGVELDGRSDLYSLGIVFYELLTGAVPYSAQDSVSVGIMHITAPLPRLPDELAWLQPVLDRLLAKEPALRFQSGADLAQALADIEQRFTPTPVATQLNTPTGFPPATVLPTPSSQSGFRPATSAGGREPTGSHEPTFGRVDAGLLGDEMPRHRRAREPGPRRLWLWLLPLLLGLGGGGLWLFQDQLRSVLPQTKVDDGLARADLALQQDRLDGEDGAYTLYNAILAIDGENSRARIGLSKVGDRWLALAGEAISRGDPAAAEAALGKAKALVPATRIEPVEVALQQLTQQGADLAGWLEQAEKARLAGRLDGGDDSALALFQKVLAADPDNAIADAGIRRILDALFGKISQAIDSAQFDQAETLLLQIRAIEPSHADIPEMQSRLSAARQQQSQSKASELQAALDQAADYRRKGQLTTPAGRNALEAYQAVLARSPDNSVAQQAIAAIGNQLLQQFDAKLADFQFDSAQALLQSAERAGVSAGRLATARDRLAQTERRQQALNRSLAQAADPQRLRTLLDEAARALAAGQLFGPPGDCAYDKYRQVLSADSSNADARQGLAGLPQEAKSRFDRAMAGNRLGEARGYVEGLDSYRPDDPGLPGMKRRLAQSYIGYANERLGAGEIRKAKQAFDHARVLDPDNPELTSLGVRLEQASPG